MAKIIVTGGGMGMGVVMRGLSSESHSLTALVSMIANGGSTGRLRSDLGILPVGNVRQVLLSLLNPNSLTYRLLDYRFEEGDLKGHTFGNIYLAALQKITDSLDLAIDNAIKTFDISGDVIPLTTRSVDMCVTLENGELICGESNLDTLNFNIDYRIVKFFLEPLVDLNPRAKEAILSANVLIFGPGDFYFLQSNFLVNGFVDAIKQARAKKIFICNITNRDGLNTGFTLNEYIVHMESYLGKNGLDYVLYNKKPLSEEMSSACLENNHSFVERGVISDGVSYKLIEADLLSDMIYEKSSNTDLVHRSMIRHDSEKLGKVLKSIIDSL